MSDATVWQLPSEVLVHILSYLPAEDIGRAAGVCSWWSQMAGERRLWRGKSFLSVDGRGLSDVLYVARALPALKRVSVRRSTVSRIYLNAEMADFEVPDLMDEVVTSAISALVAEDLSFDFALLEERRSNCLVMQLHKLKELKVCAVPSLLPRNAVAAKLQALGGTLSREPLPDLHSLQVFTGNYSVKVEEYLDSDILGILSTLAALERVTLRTRSSLSWHTVTEFSKLQVLHIQGCIIEDISFLDLCPVLNNLSLADCSPLGMSELSRKSALTYLGLCNLPVSNKVVDTLCCASPKLEKIFVHGCPHVSDTSFLGHCPKLRVLELGGYGLSFPHVMGFPPGLEHLKLISAVVTSDSLVEMLRNVPELKILDVLNCNVGSLRFLRHCPGLNELFLGLAFFGTYQHFHALGSLRNMKKLYLQYGEMDIEPLTDVVCKMPALEVLDVGFLRTVWDLSFLEHCRQLRSLSLGFYFPTNMERLCFKELSNLKELRSLALQYAHMRGEDLADILPNMPHLEELGIQFVDTECNLSFLSHCCGLTSLRISCFNMSVSHLSQLRQLRRLKGLTVLGLSDKDRQLLAEEVPRLPELEFLCLERDGPNFLESWEWRQGLLSRSSNG